MPSLGQILSRTFFWSYERGTWQYDLAVILILVFVLLTPRNWFRDKPQSGAPVTPGQVQLISKEGNRLKHRPSEMSGGEQQRVAIARAIVNEPKIILADEPTGNLDTQNSEIVLSMLSQLNKELGQTIVMITHNPEAAAYSNRVVHMRDGVIVDGVPAD